VPARAIYARHAERDFHGEKRTNAAHPSTTDPDARLYRKSPSQGAKLCHMGHLTTENRYGPIVETELTPATGWGERAAAEAMIEDLPRCPHATLAADKAYDTAAFVANMREQGVVPHLAQNISGRRSAIDGWTTRHPNYAVSQRARKRIEEAFGWIKTIGGLRKPRHRGRDKVRWTFTLTAAAYNLIRLKKTPRGGLMIAQSSIVGFRDHAETPTTSGRDGNKTTPSPRSSATC